MQLLNLMQRPDAISQLAQWHFQEWRHLFPHRTAQDFANELAECLHQSEMSETELPLPQSWVLVSESGEICGSVSLLLADMTTNRQLSPWLANVFIAPQYRGQGFGRAVVKAAMEKAFSRQLTQLFLFTPDQQAFYEQLGWQLLHQECYEGEWVSIMNWLVPKKAVGNQ